MIDLLDLIWNHRMGPLYSTYILLFPGIPNPSLLSREFKSRIPTWTWTCQVQVQVEIRDFNPEVRKCTNEHSIIIMNSTSTKTKLWREYDTLQSELPMTIPRITLGSIYGSFTGDGSHHNPMELSTSELQRMKKIWLLQIHCLLLWARAQSRQRAEQVSQE